MKQDLIQMTGIGKTVNIESTFLEIECSQRFIDKIKSDYGLLVEYNEKELTIYYESDKSRSETETRKEIENDNIVIFLMRQDQGDNIFYMMCPYWYIDQNYNIQPNKK